MEKVVNDIYNDCEDLTHDQLACLIDNLEMLSESKDVEVEENPSEQVARENCEAIS